MLGRRGRLRVCESNEAPLGLIVDTGSSTDTQTDSLILFNEDIHILILNVHSSASIETNMAYVIELLQAYV